MPSSVGGGGGGEGRYFGPLGNVTLEASYLNEINLRPRFKTINGLSHLFMSGSYLVDKCFSSLCYMPSEHCLQ